MLRSFFIDRAATPPRRGGENSSTKSRVRRIKHVAAGFQPAFNHQNNSFFVIERGLEARAYELTLVVRQVY